MRLPLCEVCEKPLRAEDSLPATASHVRCVREQAIAEIVPREMHSVSTQNEAKGEKTRVFTATEVATIEADLWEGANNGNGHRPCYAVYAGSDSELKSFGANIRLGRKLRVPARYRNRSNYETEFVRSAGYVQAYQRHPEGSTLTVYLPDLFMVDPGMVDSKSVAFVVSPSREWTLAQLIPDEGLLIRDALSCEVPDWQGHVYGEVLTPAMLAEWVPLAFLFAVYLDRRTRVPLLADGRFYFRIFLGMLASGLASFGDASDYGSHWYGHDSAASFGHRPLCRFREKGVEAAGNLPGVACKASHEEVEHLLACEVKALLRVS